MITYYSIHKSQSLGSIFSKKNLMHVFSPYSLNKNLPFFSFECQQRVSKYFIFRVVNKNLVFSADFVLMLATCLASFIQIIRGKEYKTGSSYYEISCHFLLYVPLVSSDLTAHTHSDLNFSLRLRDKLSPPCTMSTKLLRVLLSPVFEGR